MAIGRFIAELGSLWRRAREIGGAAVIQQIFIDVSESLFGGYYQLLGSAESREEFLRGLAFRILC